MLAELAGSLAAVSAAGYVSARLHARHRRPSLDDLLDAHTRAERERRALDYSAPGVGIDGHPCWCSCGRCSRVRAQLAGPRHHHRKD